MPSRNTSLRLLLLLFLTTSCGSDQTAAPAPEPATQASRTIPAAGGSVSVTNAQGIALTVTLPEGAVLEPLRITLRAITPPPGVKARFAIEPAGARLLAPASFIMKLPDGVTLRQNTGLSFGGPTRVPVPTQVDLNARTLTTSLYQVGFDPANDQFAIAGDAPATLSDGSEFIDAQDFECQVLRESLQLAIDRALAFSGAFPPSLATPLILQHRAALAACETADSLGEVSALIRQLACDNKDSAERQAQTTQAETAQELKRNLGVLLAAEGLVQETGAEDCHVAQNTMAGEFDEFITFYIARINDPGFTANFPTWDDLFRELVTCLDIIAMAQEYNVPSAEQRIYTDLMPALFARLHEVAREACEEDQNGALLGDLLSGGHLLGHPISAIPGMPFYMGFDISILQREYITCGSAVHADCFDHFAVFVIDSTTVGPFGVFDRHVDANVDGTIILTPDLQNFVCGNIISRPPVKVRAEKDGTTAQLGQFNGAPLNVRMSTTLSALGIDPEDPDEFDLVMFRSGIPCGMDALGPPTFDMFRITVFPVESTPRIGATNYQGRAEYGTPEGCTERVDLTGTISQSASHVTGSLSTGDGTHFGSFAGNLVGHHIVDIRAEIEGCGVFDGLDGTITQLPQGGARWFIKFGLGLNCSSYFLCNVYIDGGPDCPLAGCGTDED